MLVHRLGSGTERMPVIGILIMLSRIVRVTALPCRLLFTVRKCLLDYYIRICD